MEITRNGNVKIEINPERKYQGQFVGYKYYKLTDLQKVFPNVADFGELNPGGFDLGAGANNTDMICHHIQPYRRNGYIVK